MDLEGLKDVYIDQQYCVHFTIIQVYIDDILREGPPLDIYQSSSDLIFMVPRLYILYKIIAKLFCKDGRCGFHQDYWFFGFGYGVRWAREEDNKFAPRFILLFAQKEKLDENA